MIRKILAYLAVIPFFLIALVFLLWLVVYATQVMLILAAIIAFIWGIDELGRS